MRKRLTRDEALLKAGKYAELIKFYNGMFTTTPPTVALPTPGALKKNMNPREAELHAAASLPRGTSPSKKTEPSLRPELLTGKGGVSPSDAKARATEKTSPSADKPVTKPKSTVKASTRSDAQSTPAPAVKAAASEVKPSSRPSLLPLPFPDKQSSAPMKTTSVEVPLSAVTSVKQSKPLLPPVDAAKEKVTEGSITDFINKILRPKRRH